MKNVFKDAFRALFPTKETRRNTQFDRGFKFGREKFMPATNFGELDRLYDDLPIENGHPFDDGIKAAYREKNTLLGDIDHMAHRIRPPVAKPAWAQGVDILNLQVGDPFIMNVKKHPDGRDEITSVVALPFTELRCPVISDLQHADSWRTLMGIRRVGDDERGKPMYRGKADTRRV